jgi:putative transposase
VEEEIAPLPPTGAAIGLDMGASALVTLSTDEKITNAKHQALGQRRIRKAQKALAPQAERLAEPSEARRKFAPMPISLISASTACIN